MFRCLRLRRVHARFLESSRNLKEGRAYWDQAGPFRRWLLQTLVPAPLLGLHEDGRLLLAALEWLESRCREEPLREAAIGRYHEMISPAGAAGAGEYRKRKVTVAGSSVARPGPERVPALMKQLDLKMVQEQEALDKSGGAEESAVMRVAAEIHQRIAFIHPFGDGNGRVARLAMNHVLRRYGAGYVILPPLSESREHFEALEEAHRGNVERFIELARKCLWHI